MKVMREVDPDGVEQRAKRRLKRRKYRCKVYNYRCKNFILSVT